jgi:hypothetical protein
MGDENACRQLRVEDICKSVDGVMDVEECAELKGKGVARGRRVRE